ncbi:TPA: hypothetical protein QC364_000842 [Bacillus cereus]|nr:hypothetical protein [Bacillus cereus]
MAIKTAQANYDNGTTYDVLHYETQVKQVKVLDPNGNVTGDLQGKLDSINSDITVVDAKTINNATDISGLKTSVGTASALTTTAKTVVPAINEVKGKTDTNTTAIAGVDKDLQTFKGHNHDTVYVKLSGGDLTNTLAVANGKSFAGKDSSGAKNLNIGMVNATSDIVLGDKTAKTIIQAKTTDLSITDGTNTYKIIHTGNDGSGSGLDADTVDGIHGDKFARVDIDANFQKNVIVQNGQDIILRASAGSFNSGDLIFAEGGNGEIGRVFVDSNGSLVMRSQFYGDMKVRGDGVITSEYGIELNSKNKETDVKFRADDGDKGMGFYMNKTTRQLGMYDWQNDRFFFTTDRNRSVVEFGANQIRIGGKRLFVDWVQPQNADDGDVWIKY